MMEPNADWSPPPMAQQVMDALHALLSAAALHLGEALPDGTKLDKPDPLEAHMALLAAIALADRFAAAMPPEARDGVALPLERLLAVFAERHGDMQLPAPGLATGVYKDLALGAWIDQMK